MKRIIIIIILLLIAYSFYGQNSGWVTIIPPNGYFSFKMPAQPSSYDTMNLKFYTYSVDTDIVMQVYYYDAGTVFGNNNSDSIDNPLLFFAGQLLYSTNGTLSSIDALEINESIRGKEIGITYPVLDTTSSNDTTEIYIFTRVYHDGHSLLSFYVSAPERRLNDLIALKNSFFANIAILN